MKRYFFVFLITLTMLTSAIAFAEAVDAVPKFTVDLTQIIVALLGLLASLITAKLIPWIQANTNEKQQRVIEAAVKTAVYAADQMFTSMQGKEKLMYVKAELAKKGYKVDLSEIEAAVQALRIAQHAGQSE